MLGRIFLTSHHLFAGALTALAVVAGCGGATTPTNERGSDVVKTTAGSGTTSGASTTTGASPSGAGGGMGTTGGSGTGGAPDTNDPFGSCVVGPEPGSNWPLVCTNGHAPCTGADQGSSCTSQGCEPRVFHVMCDNTCNVDADCPVPSSGTARPSCEPDYHFCRLACATDAECPHGSTCQDGTRWLARGSMGQSLGLPMMCMQTVTVVGLSVDGGR